MKFTIRRSIGLGSMLFVYLMAFAINYTRYGTFEMSSETYLVLSIVGLCSLVLYYEIRDLKDEIGGRGK